MKNYLILFICFIILSDFIITTNIKAHNAVINHPDNISEKKLNILYNNLSNKSSSLKSLIVSDLNKNKTGGNDNFINFNKQICKSDHSINFQITNNAGSKKEAKLNKKTPSKQNIISPIYSSENREVEPRKLKIEMKIEHNKANKLNKNLRKESTDAKINPNKDKHQKLNENRQILSKEKCSCECISLKINDKCSCHCNKSAGEENLTLDNQIRSVSNPQIQIVLINKKNNQKIVKKSTSIQDIQDTNLPVIHVTSNLFGSSDDYKIKSNKIIQKIEMEMNEIIEKLKMKKECTQKNTINLLLPSERIVT